MKERPILFNAPMVRAILAGTKTQTRRVAKGLALEWLSEGFTPEFVADHQNRICPYGQPGDRLWVRETFAIVPRTAYRCSEGVQQVLRHGDDHDAAIFREGWDRSRSGFRWRPSIHMPRWASRITLEIVSVRVERLQDISEADAKSEGVSDFGNITDQLTGEIDRDAVEAYQALWESINGPGSWDANPWVWVVEFRRMT